ncbi:MAG: hypothetical protein ACI9VT_003689, partial [Psychroserpens sp.]
MAATEGCVEEFFFGHLDLLHFISCAYAGYTYRWTKAAFKPPKFHGNYRCTLLICA